MKSIGSYTPKNPFFLAPMEAVNCAAFRKLCHNRGAGLVYTDMIDADEFAKIPVSEAIKKFVNPDKIPLAIQIGGANIQNLVYTVNALQKHAVLIDYNIGCPLPYMLGKKGGAYLSKHPEQLYKIIVELRNACKIPLTVKMRMGWDEQSINAIEICKQLEIFGVDAITLHPRTRKQGYKNKADWPYARKVRDAINIPFILSGDVTNAYLAHRAFEHVKPDYIMIGRGAQKNPSIFTVLNNYWQNPSISEKPLSTYNKKSVRVKKDFLEFLELYKKLETYKFSQIKDHALWFAAECQNNKLITKKILNATTESDLIKIISYLKFT